ncbi:spirocyclase AveC family protein [Mycobacteroides abscessus]|uniref:spirocyclase AveC family protein n=1 Tax=Mycobacteroides abscessus TaxID=36809 RepID=UPI000D947DB5|nr:spirocyclase AveC family protein [Mycobacteroides abscessus]SPX87963.1 postpolyketide modification protein [Mycobacteroides abscessus]
MSRDVAECGVGERATTGGVREEPTEIPRQWIGSTVAFLASVAALLFAYQAIAWAGYIADGPRISVNRDNADFYWWAARVVESIVVLSIVGWSWYVLRERRHTGRLGTDGLLMLGMFGAAFWDPIYNWLVPAWQYSTNLVTLNDWFAHAPGIVNPDAGTMQWSVVMVLVGYPLWGVGFGAIIDIAMRKARHRFPQAAGGAVLAAGLAIGVALTAISFSLFKALGLMQAPGFDLGMPGGELIPMALSGGIVFWGIGLIRHYRDRDGRSIVELPQSAWMRFLTSAGLCQLLVVVGWGFLTVPLSLHSEPYPSNLPSHLIEHYCDPPGTPNDTAYGECPGSPGFKLPIMGVSSP